MWFLSPFSVPLLPPPPIQGAGEGGRGNGGPGGQGGGWISNVRATHRFWQYVQQSFFPSPCTPEMWFLSPHPAEYMSEDARNSNGTALNKKTHLFWQYVQHSFFPSPCTPEMWFLSPFSVLTITSHPGCGHERGGRSLWTSICSVI